MEQLMKQTRWVFDAYAYFWFAALHICFAPPRMKNIIFEVKKEKTKWIKITRLEWIQIKILTITFSVFDVIFYLSTPCTLSFRLTSTIERVWFILFTNEGRKCPCFFCDWSKKMHKFGVLVGVTLKQPTYWRLPFRFLILEPKRNKQEEKKLRYTL